MIYDFLYWVYSWFCSHKDVIVYYHIDDIAIAGLGGQACCPTTICCHCNDYIYNPDENGEKQYVMRSHTLNRNFRCISKNYVKNLLASWNSDAAYSPLPCDAEFNEEEYKVLIEWVKEKHPDMPIEE